MIIQLDAQRPFGGHSVLAKVNLSNLDSYIKIMYAAAITLATDVVNPDLVNMLPKLMPGATKVEAEVGSDIIDVLLPIIKNNDVDEDELEQEMKELRKLFRTVFLADVDIDHDRIDQLKALTVYLYNRNESALKKLVMLAPVTGEKTIINALTFKPNSQKEFTKPLEVIVKKVAGRSGQILSVEEQKRLKASNPKVHKEYLRLRKMFNQVWKDELRQLVNSTNSGFADYQKVLKYMTSQGIQHPLPKGFEGLIDANGKIYTKKGKAINGGLPGIGFSVVMNPEYDPVLDNVFIYTTVNDAGETSQYVYSVDYKSKAIKEKFANVAKLDKVIDKIRAKWMTHVKRGGTDQNAVAATLLEMIYQFSARVGSMGNKAGGESTYGMSTLLGQHVKVSGNKLVIKYKGKDGVQQIHVVSGSTPEGKILLRNMSVLAEGKGKNDRIFTYEKGGKVLPMTGNMINQAFKALGSPVTVHKLRHVRGSRLFKELLDQNESQLFNPKKPLSQAQADAAIKQLATKVGELLGHVRGIGAQQKVTPSTAIQNYIDPGLLIGFYDKLSLRVPKFLQKLAAAQK